MQSNIVAVNYTEGEKVMFQMTVLHWLIKTATDSSDVLQYLTKGDGTALACVV